MYESAGKSNKYKPSGICDALSERPANDELAKNTEMLLGLGVGNRRILEQIHRAAVNRELISNHEWTYIDSLLETHAVSIRKAPTATPQRVQETPPKTGGQAKRSSRTIAIAGGAAVAAVVVAAALLMPSGSPNETVSDPVPVLMVGVDSAGYDAGDFILVEGLSDVADGAVDIHIMGPSGQVWYERVLPNEDGSFSTIALAGLEEWSAGAYTVRAVHGNSTHESTFSFGDGR